jgi:hypothetical protein
MNHRATGAQRLLATFNLCLDASLVKIVLHASEICLILIRHSTLQEAAIGIDV